MLSIVVSIIGIFITILFVVGTHEFGHFITARMLKVKVLRFSIGFGKTLLRWQGKSDTEYVFALIPLGGYVKMLDENEGDVPESQLHQAYNRQPIYKKFLIVLAGPLTNLICAAALYWLIFVIGFVTIKPVTGSITPDSIAYKGGLRADQVITKINSNDTPSWMSVIFKLLYQTGSQSQLTVETVGWKTNKTQQHTLDLTHWRMDNLKPDPLKSLGIQPYRPHVPATINIVQPDSPAAGKLQVDDTIIAIDGKRLKGWGALVKVVHEHPDQTVKLTVQRGNKKIPVTITLGAKKPFMGKAYGYLGAAPKFKPPKDLLQKVQYSPVPAIGRAVQKVYNFTYLNFFLIGKMLTGKLSLQSLGGPITIFGTAGDALNSGFITFINFLAFLSIAIGVINFLPIPGLDGGHLLIQIIESIIRRPLPERMVVGFYKLGLLLIFFLLFQSLLNDILRLL